MYLSHLNIKNHPILKDLKLNLTNPNTNQPYAVVAFVGENGCGKTTILNEIFNYEKSDFIFDKQTPYTIVPKPFDALYLRQGSLHRNAMKEVRKLIDGQDMYPINSATYTGGANPFGLRSNNAVNRINEGIKLLEKLGDDEITTIFKENHIDEVWCSGEVTKKIDGQEHGYNITNYSSGQQEILLKIKDIRKMASGTDCVLLDEPETSLHPRWQKEIVNLIKLMLTDVDGNVPQIFLATHSEKVLESLITRDDVLIVRLSKHDGNIKTETIDEMDLRLPTPTFAELDYVVFHIPSLEYHDELFNRFAYQIGKNSTVAADEKIQKLVKKLYKNNANQFEKTRIYVVHGKPYSTNTIPTYIRDFFHHPNEMQAPTEDELVKSIELMRELVKFMDEKGTKEVEQIE
jgi:ABC-type lipoprotein export system ATPase subunit